MTKFNTDDLRRVEKEMSELELRVIEEAMARVRAEADIRQEHLRSEAEMKLQNLRAEAEMKLENLRARSEERLVREVSRARAEGIREGWEQAWKLAKRVATAIGWVASLSAAVWAAAVFVVNRWCGA